jgi:hypothetical protein
LAKSVPVLAIVVSIERGVSEKIACCIAACKRRYECSLAPCQ